MTRYLHTPSHIAGRWAGPLRNRVSATAAEGVARGAVQHPGAVALGLQGAGGWCSPSRVVAGALCPLRDELDRCRRLGSSHPPLGGPRELARVDCNGSRLRAETGDPEMRMRTVSTVAIAVCLMLAWIPSAASSSATTQLGTSGSVSVSARGKIIKYKKPAYVNDRYGTEQLKGAPAKFKKAVFRYYKKMQKEATQHGCQSDPVVAILTVWTSGWARGVADNGCPSGWETLWAKKSGRWKMVQGTQQVVECDLLTKYRFPAGFEDSCYTESGTVLKYRGPNHKY